MRGDSWAVVGSGLLSISIVVSSKLILHLAVPRHRLSDVRCRVTVPIVLATVAHQFALERLDGFHELHALHETVSSPTR